MSTIWHDQLPFRRKRVVDPTLDTWIYPNYIAPTVSDTSFEIETVNDYDIYGFDDMIYDVYFYVNLGRIDFNLNGRYSTGPSYDFVFPYVSSSCRIVDNYYETPVSLYNKSPFTEYRFNLTYSSTGVPSGLRAGEFLVGNYKVDKPFDVHEYAINGLYYYAIDYVPMSVLPKVVVDYLNLITYQYIQILANPPIENFIEYATRYWILYKYRTGVFIKTEPPNLNMINLDYDWWSQFS